MDGIKRNCMVFVEGGGLSMLRRVPRERLFYRIVIGRWGTSVTESDSMLRDAGCFTAV